MYVWKYMFNPYLVSHIFQVTFRKYLLRYCMVLFVLK